MTTEPTGTAFEVDGQTIGVRPLGGQGPLVVAVHGAEGGWREWEPLAGRLADRFRLVALDLPWRAGNDYAWGRTAGAGEWLGRAMALLGEPAAGMIGHSLGANALLEYLCAPGRPALGGAMVFAPFYRPAADPVDEALEREFAGSFRFAVADGIRIALGARYEALGESLFESIVDTALDRIGEFGIGTLFRQFANTGTLDLSRVDVPTRVLVGDTDPALIRRRSDALGRAMPAATVSRRPAYGHCFHVSHADELAAEVGGFLAGAIHGTGDPTRGRSVEHAHA
ncbi:alpha/beta hydrolase [Kitasatospora sp. NPDC097643]|uniref:alpha/beta fold hydrolase n=1 Tax=Kitasatospora sp. NPDC097643 TaxID=3157230 RepID=UPI00331BE823